MQANSMTKPMIIQTATKTEECTRTYYCSMKFKFLKIDIPSQTIYNCHASAPQPVNKSWIEQNPGQLFNTPTNVNERIMMLNNERAPSCEQNCWRAEDNGAISPRLNQKGLAKTHTEINTLPEEIDLTLDKNCNLTCSYCCSEFSSAWTNDLINNGDYYEIDNLEGNRYSLTPKHKVQSLLSKAELKNTSFYQLWLKEFANISKNLKVLTITGGEPLLNNDLLELLPTISNDVKILIYTGLGVSDNRLIKFLKLFQKINVKLIISCETTEKLFEFNRYGETWENFIRRVDIIKQHGIEFVFQNTISNLTIHGICDFVKYYSEHKMFLTFVYTPKFMAPYVMDEQTKDSIRNSIFNLPEMYQKNILASISGTPDDKDRENLSVFLREFVRRRPDLTVKIYPTTLLSWLGL